MFHWTEIIAAGTICLLVGTLAAVAYRRWFRMREGAIVLVSIRKHCGLTLVVLLVLLGGLFLLRLVLDPGAVANILRHFLVILSILACGLLLYKLTNVFEDYIWARFDLTAKDNLRARQVHTQFRILQRMVLALAVLLSVSAILLTFESLESLGKGLFASAGVAGLIVGLSAQKTIGAFIAGVQLALTQPMRLDDVVIVEGEWGRIEEITLTYAVVRLWDLRRLVLPLTYFLEHPFQNWTRKSAEIIGTVFLNVDYTVPVKAVRRELESICRNEASSLWDGKTCVLQVTDAGPEVMTLRALVSAQDAPMCWDLRCLVREKLVDYLQREHPQGLPRTRLSLRQESSKGGAS